MKERIKELLEENLPLIDIESDFMFEELNSLDVATILMLLSDEYHITLDSADATPKNLRSVDSLAAMVEEKLK